MDINEVDEMDEVQETENPVEGLLEKETRKTKTKPIPKTKMTEKPMPQIGNPENTVEIDGSLIEIKPTKLKYHRNRTAVFYTLLEIYPLPDILSMDEGAFGDDRDGDKALMDWLIAVFDDEDFVTAHYNEMTSETIHNLLQIFRRVNRIDEREKARKNLEASRRGATVTA